jgi:hypothetical protein
MVVLAEHLCHSIQVVVMVRVVQMVHILAAVVVEAVHS